MNIDNLFNVCTFKEESDIIKEFNINDSNQDDDKINSIKNYIEIKKNISKSFLPILFNICKDKINIFIENEKNNNEGNIKDELIMILDGLKNIDSYCSEIKDIPQNEILKTCINNKKGHLFMLHHYFNKLIFSKNEEIKKRIFEIFEIITEQMDLKE